MNPLNKKLSWVSESLKNALLSREIVITMRRVNTIKTSSLPKGIYNFNKIQINHELEVFIPKFTWKNKGIGKSKKTWKRLKKRSSSLELLLKVWLWLRCMVQAIECLPSKHKAEFNLQYCQKRKSIVIVNWKFPKQ
jgi:hypothetical protein